MKKILIISVVTAAVIALILLLVTTSRIRDRPPEDKTSESHSEESQPYVKIENPVFEPEEEEPQESEPETTEDYTAEKTDIQVDRTAENVTLERNQTLAYALAVESELSNLTHDSGLSRTASEITPQSETGENTQVFTVSDEEQLRTQIRAMDFAGQTKYGYSITILANEITVCIITQ